MFCNTITRVRAGSMETGFPLCNASLTFIHPLFISEIFHPRPVNFTCWEVGRRITPGRWDEIFSYECWKVGPNGLDQKTIKDEDSTHFYVQYHILALGLEAGSTAY